MRRLTPAGHDDFAVLAGTARSQGAVMTLGPGESTGGPDNRHAGSDQWLFVVSGRGHAVVAGERMALESGVLLLVEAGETHEVAAGEDEPLVTWNVYAPPEY